MASADWTCPACKTGYDAGQHPDHWNDGCGSFEFECECGVDFTVEVDHSVNFYVRRNYRKRAR